MGSATPVLDEEADDSDGDEPLPSLPALLVPDDEALVAIPVPLEPATDALRFRPVLAVGASSSARLCRRECRCSVSLRVGAAGSG